MLDAVAVDRVVRAVEGELDRVDRLAQRLVADRVDGELKTLPLRVACFRL
jgi:hypothetical protein